MADPAIPAAVAQPSKPPKAPKPPRSRTRAFVTPEGVDLRLEIGDAGQRAAAFLLDAGIIVLTLVVLSFGALFAGFGGGGEMVFVIWLLIAFVLRNFYFTGFELSAGAATPGKRVMGLRVASRDGGRLRAESIVARNAMRELEVFLPLSVLFAPSGEGVESWMYLLGFIWAAIFVFFPLFNRDRLRAGDLVGGTWVVRAPKQKLVRDMADDGTAQPGRYVFTPEQLNAYGQRELHVLEDVLRLRDKKTLTVVADRIAAKIDWPRVPNEADYDFLSAYYAALRGRLESRLLMGKRRRDKHDV